MAEDKVKAAVKESVDQALGAAKEGGGLFHHAVASAAGDLAALSDAFVAAGDAYTQAGAEAKGYGRLLVSAGQDKLAAIAHIPDAFAVQGASARQWLDAALAGWPGAQIVEESDGTVKATAPAKPGASPEQQMKDAVAAGAAFMREKGGPVKA